MKVVSWAAMSFLSDTSQVNDMDQEFNYTSQGSVYIIANKLPILVVE